MGITARERRLLAAIEAELTRADPSFARELSAVTSALPPRAFRALCRPMPRSLVSRQACTHPCSAYLRCSPIP